MLAFIIIVAIVTDSQHACHLLRGTWTMVNRKMLQSDWSSQNLVYTIGVPMMTDGQHTCPMLTKGKTTEFQIQMLHSDWSAEKCFIVIGSPKCMHILSVYPWHDWWTEKCFNLIDSYPFHLHTVCVQCIHGNILSHLPSGAHQQNYQILNCRYCILIGQNSNAAIWLVDMIMRDSDWLTESLNLFLLIWYSHPEQWIHGEWWSKQLSSIEQCKKLGISKFNAAMWVPNWLHVPYWLSSMFN